ncbi:polysialyltransferase family glycosyltransferase [Parenemella sanctibonifatiensis]|uniref:Uncharacterized protein n=1 Tax=Parenemella sanctibonifatiensis TaxID=2016505 RepID=A0A255EDI8_9ACTN|nr:polysialyltransferase family glycosyltransferase [Parenemella sanctibonifatiensis]OYN89616.1 hypothetical protein CGZ92_02545 [Parenemella sanctibonifatiensis]
MSTDKTGGRAHIAADRQVTARKRLFVVTGAFSFINALISGRVNAEDHITVLVLFCGRDQVRDLTRQIRMIRKVDQIRFLHDPEQYRSVLNNRDWAKKLCSAPDEVRMFLTHQTWLHNRLFKHYPNARITLYEEGLASYYPGLVDRIHAWDRVDAVRTHNYLGRHVPVDTNLHPDRFGGIDKAAFLRSLAASTLEPAEPDTRDLDAVVVLEQYLFKKGESVSIDELAAEYAAAIAQIIQRGYRVLYKPHPRESTPLLDHILGQLPQGHRSRVEALPGGGMVEQRLLARPAAAVVAINSTSLLTVPHFLDIPAYRIASDAPLRVASGLPVETRGMVWNHVAMTARLPDVSALPDPGEPTAAPMWERIHALPPTDRDRGLQALASSDFGADYAGLVRQVMSEDTEEVSFDLFDTLVTRPAHEGADLWWLLDKPLRDTVPAFQRFSDARRTVFSRMAADAALAQEETPAETSLTELYAFLARRLGWDESQRDQAMAAELDLETRAVVLREAGWGLVAAAQAAQKPWFVTTDTYLDGEQLDRIALSKLPDLPLDADGQPAVYASAAFQATKASGALFGEVAARRGVPAQQLLHVGDKADHDVANAIAAGWQGAQLPAPAAAAEAALPQLWQDVRHERGTGLVRGLVESHVFDNPDRLDLDEAMVGADPETIGYAAVGPALLGWTRWLLTEATGRGIDRLLFCSRDGYRPLQWAQQLAALDGAPAGLPQMHYLFSSRTAIMPMFSADPARAAYTEFVHGLNPNNTPRTVLETRLGTEAAARLLPSVTAAGFAPERPIGGPRREEFLAVLGRLADQIAEHCAPAADRAERYYRHAVGEAERPAVVDLGYSGSSQRAVNLAVGGQPKVAGLYFTTMEHNTEYAWINDLEVAEFSQEPAFFTAGALLEWLITPGFLPECEGFVDDADAPGGVRPQLGATPQGDPIRDQVGRGAERFFADALERFGADVWQLVMRPRLWTHPLAQLFSQPGRADAMALGAGRHDDRAGAAYESILDYWPAGKKARG